MAGPAREEERQFKQDERRGIGAKQRTGSISRNGKDASRPPFVPTSDQFPPLEDPHVSVNGFNANEVTSFLVKTWADALNQLQNPTDDQEKFDVHKHVGNAWGGKSNLALNLKPGMMANGAEFIPHLRKQTRTAVNM
ncbi:uncharacterized protein VTP21DRAFT_11018 [Calcarisporiella thermophila]|uniref:uncharacterized protein n=1 Tax=Calcarisporiella thermophila TaxID=911321 RepID=UPI003744749E